MHALDSVASFGEGRRSQCRRPDVTKTTRLWQRGGRKQKKRETRRDETFSTEQMLLWPPSMRASLLQHEKSDVQVRVDGPGNHQRRNASRTRYVPASRQR